MQAIANHNESHSARSGGDDKTVAFCKAHGISYSAYSPLEGLSVSSTETQQPSTVWVLSAKAGCVVDESSQTMNSCIWLSRAESSRGYPVLCSHSDARCLVVCTWMSS